MLQALVEAFPQLSHLPPATLVFGPTCLLCGLCYVLSRAKEFVVMGFSASIYAVVPFVAICHL